MLRILTLLCLFHFPVAWADPLATLLAKAAQQQDPMPAGGAYAGQRVENIKGRTLQLLSPREKALLGISERAFAFTNFRHGGHFYIAQIIGLKVNPSGFPIRAHGAVEEVHALSEHWEALTNPDLASAESHSYLEFIFKKNHGVQLIYDQTLGARVPAGEPLVTSAVMSVEALRSQEEPNADFIPHAFVFDFAIGHLFYDLADRQQAEAADLGKVLDDVTLDFRNVKSAIAAIGRPEDALLFTSVQMSQSLGRSRTYNFVEDNCTNRMFDLLDQSLRGPRFNRQLFLDTIAVELKADAAKGMAAIKRLIAAHGYTLPDSELNRLGDLSADDIVRTVLAKAAQAQDPSRFFTWFPPFVNAHLRARGLVANCESKCLPGSREQR